MPVYRRLLVRAGFRVQGLLQCIQHEAGMSSSAHAPADDVPSVGVDDEDHIDKARPGADVGESARSLSQPHRALSGDRRS